MASSDAPIEIDSVTLTVRDLAGMAGFYQRVIGLAPLARDGSEVRLGVDGRTLVVLKGDPAAPVRGRGAAGLFHTAFLLPDRAALGGWLRHASAAGVPLDGASDHGVSEALYLDDPEGNGIEIYADRPRSAWRVDAGGAVAMGTDPLDLQALAAAAAPWDAAPAGTVIGHVHLKVGDLAPAERFWTDVVGLSVTCRYPAAVFAASGGYHHHVACNVWRSRGAPAVGYGTGLARVTLRADAEHAAGIAARTADADRLAEPFGVAVEIVAKR